MNDLILALALEIGPNLAAAIMVTAIFLLLAVVISSIAKAEEKSSEAFWNSISKKDSDKE